MCSENDRFHAFDFPRLHFDLESGGKRITFSKDMVIKRHFSIKKPVMPVVVDGRLDEWKGVAPVSLFEKDSTQAAGEIQVSYDKKYLYIAAIVHDPNLIAVNNKHMIFLNDALIVGIDRKKQSKYHGNDDLQMGISRTKLGVEIYNQAVGEQIDPVREGILAAVVNDSVSLTYELAIPVSFLKPLALKKGKEIGINFAISSVDPTGEHKLLSWTPGIGYDGVDESFQSQYHFALMKLK